MNTVSIVDVRKASFVFTGPIIEIILEYKVKMFVSKLHKIRI